ncbi:NinE family protein, partial [Escherichia coli]
LLIGCTTKTFNYTAHLWDIRWLRHRARKTR